MKQLELDRSGVFTSDSEVGQQFIKKKKLKNVGGLKFGGVKNVSAQQQSSAVSDLNYFKSQYFIS